MYQHQEFSIDLSLDIITIESLQIVEKINNHMELVLGGICLDDKIIPQKQPIAVRNREGQIICFGMLHTLEITKEKDFFKFHLKAYSPSYEMEQKRIRRVFQNQDMTYGQVIQEVLKPYKNASLLNKLSEDKIIPHTFIQFDETDWEFTKRLASHFHSGICVNGQGDSVQLLLGYYDMERMDLGGVLLARKIDLLSGQEIIKIKTHGQNRIGSCCLYKDKKYLIETGEIVLVRGELLYQAQLREIKASLFPYIPNENIAGKKLWAVVKEISRNMLRIQYQIEDTAQGRIPFLPYAGEVNNEDGYYMPEIGNEVEVTFPDSKENHAFISASRRSAKEIKHMKSNMKYMKNKDDLGLYMDEHQLNILAGTDNARLVMYKTGSVHIEAPGSISIRPGTDLEIGGLMGKVKIQAKKGITFQSGIAGGSNICLNSTGNLICKAMQRVTVRGMNMPPKIADKPHSQTDVGKGTHEVRNAALALSGVEFSSQSVTGNKDFQSSQKIMNRLLGNSNAINTTAGSDGNLIKEGLFQNDERLFNAFSYGESKKG